VGFRVADSEEVRMGFVPATDVEIIDSWNVLGLNATGSHDVRIDDVFIPMDHSWSVTEPFCWSSETLFRFPIYGMLAMGVAAVMLGIARGAIDDVLSLAADKIPTGSKRPLAQRAVVQDALARSTAQLDAARAYLRFEAERAWSSADSGGAVDAMTRTRLRMAATHAGDAATDVVERMFRVAGGTAIYRTSRLEQRFRDVNTAAQHMMIAQPTWEMAGRVLLGLGEHDQL
jgi:alkylation response protein AidB-like acyl-CoA dehydrogenase